MSCFRPSTAASDLLPYFMLLSQRPFVLLVNSSQLPPQLSNKGIQVTTHCIVMFKVRFKNTALGSSAVCT